MKSHVPLSLLAIAATLASAPSFAGESPYRPPGSPPPPAAQPKPAPAEKGYSYYCWARTLDAKTQYQTDIRSEPMPYDPAFIRNADAAWQAHLIQKLGKYQAVGNCYEGLTVSAKPAWEQALKQHQATEHIVRDEWYFDE